jgi:hypothetical protein
MTIENKTMRLFFLWLPVFTLILNTQAQVTIGSDEFPYKGAVLDLVSNNKGVLFPKVRLVVYNRLSPLLTDTVTNSASVIDREKATGMIVYNTNSNADGIPIGLAVWNGNEWISMQGNMDKSAKIKDIDCSKIGIKGTYVKNETLNPGVHKVSISLYVERKGSYKITVIAKRADSGIDNGYSFFASGIFNSVGYTTITLTGQGMPLESGRYTGKNDSLVMYINDIHYTGSTMPSIYVEDISPDYYIDCSTISTSQAVLHTEKPVQGYIKLSIVAPAKSAGAEYIIETDTIAGIKFSAKGTLTGGVQPVTLMSNGASPTKMGNISFTLTCNSSNPNITLCPINAHISGKALNLRIYCDLNTFWDHWNTTNYAGGVKRILDNPVIKESFLVDSLKTACIRGTIASLAATKKVLIDDADIILISYGAGYIDENRAKIFKDFVYKDKGVVILCYEGHGEMILNKMFDSQDILTTRIIERCIRLNRNNTIVDGEYANLTDQYVGLDGAGNTSFEISGSTTGVEELATVNGFPFFAKPKGKNFIVIGDGGIFMGGAKSFTANSIEYRPFQVSVDGIPEIRNKNGQYTSDTYNAHLFLNIMHWAIKQRLENM